MGFARAGAPTSWILAALMSLFLAACSRDNKALRDKSFADGNKYFQRGKFREASILYRRSLVFDPKYADAYYRWGLAETSLKQYGIAARALQRAYSLDPKNEDAAVRLVEIYITTFLANPKSSARLMDEAESLIRQILERNPRSYDGLRLDATIASDPDTAIHRLRQADQVKPWQSEIISALMQNLVAAGRLQQAVNLGEQFMARDKKARVIYDLLFLYYRQSSQLGRAEEILKTKITNFPSDAGSRMQLAAFYYTQNRRPQMLAQLDALRSDRKTFVHADSLIGDFYMRIGEFDLAIQSYRDGEKYEPKLSAVYQKGIADALMTQGRGREALDIVSKLHKDEPRDIEIAAIRASLLAKGDKQQIGNAVSELEALVAKQPGNPKLHLYLGRAYQAKGDRSSLDKAVQQFETSLKQNPDSIPAKLALASIHLTEGQSGLAIQIADEILKSSPLNFPAKLTRAAALVKLGESQKARQELVAILRSYKSAEARFQLASLDLAEKHYHEAEDGFQAIAQAGDSRGVLGLAECKEAQGQPAAAMQVLENELGKHPDRDAYRLALSNVEVRMGKFQDARAVLEQLARKNPTVPGLFARLGAVQAQLGDKSSAIQSYQKAYQLQPSDVQTAVSLAGLLWQAGQQEQARALYEDVLKIEPENRLALNNLAYIQAESGVDLDRALGYAQQALERSPRDPNIADTLGLIYIRKKLTDQAVQVLRDLVSRVPNKASFHLHLAMALYDARKYELAKKELGKALNHDPSASEQDEIKQLMARID